MTNTIETHNITETKGKTILISAGEASGDAHAARMVNELRAIDDTLHFVGMGGDNMRRAGVEILTDIKKMAVMGLVEVLLKYRSIKAELVRLQHYIEQHSPDLLILVDYQEFNQRLAAFAKNHGVKVLFYIGPQVWAWRPKRVYKMAKIVDHMAVILPFEVDYYKQTSVPVTFTGHPLTDEVQADKTVDQARQLLQLENKTSIGLFPGSRADEIKRILPILINTAKILIQHKPDLQFVLPLATTIHYDNLRPFDADLSALHVQIIKDKFYDVSQSCDVIITASGTATLEITLLGIPMVIVYRVSPLSYFILSRLAIVKFVGLMNIIANREIVREFLQHKARPNNISKEVLQLLDNQNYNTKMRHELSLVREQLGHGGGSKNIARLAYQLLTEPVIK